MTEIPPDDTRNDQSDESDRTQSGRGGLSGLLRRLLETIQQLDETGRSVERTSGRRQSGRTTFEYDYSVKIGGDHGGLEDRTADSSVETDQPVSVQDTLDGASVTIDLPGIDPETLRAGVRGRRLVVASSDDRVARVTLPEAGYAVRNATYNNGILEILLDDDAEVSVDD